MRPLYRARQLWFALRAVPTAEGLEQVRRFLPSALMALYMRQQPSEQDHSLQIFLRLCEHGERSPDLLTAALLHDVGKSKFPLRPWERILIVLGQTLLPARSQRWGNAEPRGWKRPFVVAAQHPAWGAEMAEAAGASQLVVRLIRRHQEPQEIEMIGIQDENRLLLQLQLADNES